MNVTSIEENVVTTGTSRTETGSTKGTINLRVSDEQKALIDRAASRLGKSRTEFMLDSAREAAENALLDQRLFFLDEATFAFFAARLDRPVDPPRGLQDLLASPSPWDK